MPLNVGLQAKRPRLVGNRGCRIHFRWRVCDRK